MRLAKRRSELLWILWSVTACLWAYSRSWMDLLAMLDKILSKALP